jgi:proline-specific peptidase
MTLTKEREGLLDVTGGRVWYRIEGSGPGVPLLLLHGGPGAGHDYLEPLSVLGDERPVVFYDQLGCGKSDIPDDTSLWTIERFVAEIDAVRRGLGLERIHLLGQSWGGWLAIEYMLGKPEGIVSLTLASTSASTPGCLREMRKLIEELPPEMVATIDRCEREGTTESAEYMAAVFTFYQKHLCRMQPWPPEMLRTGMNIQATPVYHFMWGPSEFTCTGNLKSWDRSDRIAEITAPTLITVGRYDEIPLPLAEEMHQAIAGSQLVVFEESAHSAHAEEPELYAQVLREFFRRTEAAA